MGDDVVKLTSDSCALIDRGLPHALVAVALELRGAGAQFAREHPAITQCTPDRERQQSKQRRVRNQRQTTDVCVLGVDRHDDQQPGEEEAAGHKKARSRVVRLTHREELDRDDEQRYRPVGSLGHADEEAERD